MKPSDIRKKEAYRKAKLEVYKNKGSIYNEALNPYYTELERYRFERYYNNIRRRYIDCEISFSDF